MSYPSSTPTALPPDPFDVPPSVPSLSFKDAPVGTTYVGKVVRLPNLVQSRDFESNELAFWEDGNPKMSAVFHIEINGEERSVWCAKPSSLFAAVVAAQGENGQRMAIGDTVAITYIGERPNEKNPRLNPAKQYAVKITPHDPFAQATNGHGAAAAPAPTPTPAAPTAPAPMPAPVPAQAGVPQYAPTQPAPAPMPIAADPGEALALLGQVKALVGMGFTDEQIHAAMPQVSPEALAAIRSIPA